MTKSKHLLCEQLDNIGAFSYHLTALPGEDRAKNILCCPTSGKVLEISKVNANNASGRIKNG